MKCLIGIAVVLLVSGVRGENEFEFLEKRFLSVSVTKTNLSFKFKGAGWLVERSNERYGKASEYAKRDEPIILTTDQKTTFASRHVFITFTPVSFKNQHKGFRIAERHEPPASHRHLAGTSFFYLALSDVPIEVSEDDVEMILENGEWKKVEREGGAEASPPSRSNAKKGKATVDDEQGEGRATASPPSRLWLYAVIALCTLSAVLWLARKK